MSVLTALRIMKGDVVAGKLDKTIFTQFAQSIVGAGTGGGPWPGMQPAAPDTLPGKRSAG